MEERKGFGFEFRRLHNLIKTVIYKSRPITNKPPLTQLQGGIISYLYHHQEQPVFQKNIEEEFRISGATATNTLRVMEKNGLITRSCVDKDARLKRISMTEPARQDYMMIEAHRDVLEQKMLSGLSHAEREELFRMLETVCNNLENMNRELDMREIEEGDGKPC